MAICKESKKKNKMMTKMKRKYFQMLSACYSTVFDLPAPVSTKSASNFKINEKKKKKRSSPLKIAVTTCLFSMYSSFVGNHNKKKNNNNDKNKPQTSRLKKTCHCSLCSYDEEEMIPLLEESKAEIQSPGRSPVLNSALPDHHVYDDDETICKNIHYSCIAEVDAYDENYPHQPSAKSVPIRTGNDPDHADGVSESKEDEVAAWIEFEDIVVEEEVAAEMLTRKLMMEVNENKDEDVISDLSGDYLCYAVDSKGNLVKLQDVMATEKVIGSEDLMIDTRDPKISNDIINIEDNDDIFYSSTSLIKIRDIYESKTNEQVHILDDSENKINEPSILQNDNKVQLIDNKKRLLHRINMTSIMVIVTGIWFLSRLSTI